MRHLKIEKKDANRPVMILFALNKCLGKINVILAGILHEHWEIIYEHQMNK
jgi:hypothetical protein